MAIYAVYIINKAGSLIFHHDNVPSREPVQKTFTYPIDIKFRDGERLIVHYGEQADIKVGYALISVNGTPVNGKLMPDGQKILDFLEVASNYPVTLQFQLPRPSANERIMLASMFHSLWAIASKLSPEKNSSGIEVLEAESFHLHCLHTLTGLKFLLMADPGQAGVGSLLRKVYEVYADYALKNPFYSLEMPIRCELFDYHLQKVIEQAGNSLGSL
eukprot:scpid96583/ scgid32028/ Trafficking protein particle complex subunit 4